MTNSKVCSTENDTSDKPADYQAALDLAENGRYDEALVCIQEYLGTSPDDAEALNDAGAILHCLGCPDEAINHLIKARGLQPESAEIIWNLTEAYLAADKAKEAMALFEDMESMGTLNADILNRTANILLNEGNLSDAVKMLNRSLELWPEQKNLMPMIEIITGKMAENKGQ